MTSLRRAIAAALLGMALVPVAATGLYRIDYGQFPPTRLNVLLWIGPEGDACVERALNPERAPFFGTGIGLGEICPKSKYGPGDYDVVDRALFWVLLFAGLSTAAAWVMWPRYENRADHMR